MLKEVTMQIKKLKLNERTLPIAMLAVAVLSFVAAIVVLICAIGADAAYKKVLLILSTVLFLAMAGLSLYYVYLARESDPNFFTWDKTLKRNIAVEDLTFAMVNDRMELYISQIVESDEELWQGGALVKGGTVCEPYRPLVAYKMLYDLTVKDQDEDWAYLEQADKKTIRLITRALVQANEQELAQTLVDLYQGDCAEGENMRDFISGNARYLQAKMLRYTKKNIDCFY